MGRFACDTSPGWFCTSNKRNVVTPSVRLRITSDMNVLRTFLLITFTAMVPYPKNVLAADSPDADRDVREGMKLSVEDAQQLEETLKHKPEDLSIRAQLLGYYWSRHQHSDWIDGIREREVLWLVEHHPETQLAGLPYAQFNANSNPSAYEEVAKLWKQQIAVHTN